eukprot:gnl/MRDRNA2_/MRDRNA2_90572_c0_seq1.p1 gnl/MRDRNA2_/MRDRNA2_90572_c0~~gnl/MRDRNA2_/MRDRNA2_90572_c0_seq1.p1  ORF type:complete len:226 (+),score=44.95 gnl/MRDRNA2_/MRDRNA2_90572_c0_seq1:56-733(+)
MAMHGKYEERVKLQSQVQSLQDDLEGELRNIRDLRDAKIATARQVYLRKVIHGPQNEDKHMEAKEAFEIETKAIIAECDGQIQEAIRTLQPTLDELHFHLGNADQQIESYRFSVNVCDIAGEIQQVANLKLSDTLLNLYDKIAEQCAVPSFAVRICVDGQLLGAESANQSLGQLGFSEESEVMLVKVWGWAKPQLDLLTQFQKEWERRPSAPWGPMGPYNPVLIA